MFRHQGERNEKYHVTLNDKTLSDSFFLNALTFS